MIDVSVIVVSWNTRELLAQCLESVRAEAEAKTVAVETIVVDNHSEDGSPAMVRARFPEVRLVENEDNLGFVGGQQPGPAAGRRALSVATQQRRRPAARRPGRPGGLYGHPPGRRHRGAPHHESRWQPAVVVHGLSHPVARISVAYQATRGAGPSLRSQPRSGREPGDPRGRLGIRRRPDDPPRNRGSGGRHGSGLFHVLRRGGLVLAGGVGRAGATIIYRTPRCAIGAGRAPPTSRCSAVP